MNRIQEFLQGYEESTIEDIAAHGIECGAIGELIYTQDILNFFNRYYSDIEAVITDHIEGLTGDTFYDLTNTELMEELNEYTNLEFTTGDEMLEILLEEAQNQAMEDLAAEWYDMDEEEQEELVFDYMDFVEVLPTEQDKLNFVALAVELVAGDMVEG